MLRSKYRRSPGRGFFIVALVFFSIVAAAQDIDGLLDRLQGYEGEGGNYFFNSDGVDVTCVTATGPFTAKNVAKSFAGTHVKARKLKPDPGLQHRNYYQPGEILVAPNLSSTLDYYFVEDSSNMVAFVFESNHEISQEFERTLINLFLDRKIPREIYQPRDGYLNFAGHKVILPGSCQWDGATHIRCETVHLRWSSFKSEDMARADRQNHLLYIEGEGSRITTKETIHVIFEGQEVRAIKIFFQLPGEQLGRFTFPGKFVMGYLVVAEVRGRYVSFVGMGSLTATLSTILKEGGW